MAKKKKQLSVAELIEVAKKMIDEWEQYLTQLEEARAANSTTPPGPPPKNPPGI